MDIVVKYCGGCNCQIDRSQIITDIENTLTAGHHLTSNATVGPFDAGILVCGCPVACARKPELDDWAPRWIVIAGKTVDIREMPEEQIAAAVVQIIEKMKDGGR
ncbi:MAG: hypothetical protein K4571_14720 [Deltaproteobacteria bacterium]